MKPIQKYLAISLPLIATAFISACVEDNERPATSPPPTTSTGGNFSIQVDIDSDNDGEIDDSITVLLDQFGIPMNETFSVEGTTNVALDDFGNVKSIEMLVDLDENPDTSDDKMLMEFHNGKMIKQSYDDFNDGNNGWLSEMNYKADGSLNAIKYDSNGNGNFETIIFIESVGENYEDLGIFRIIGFESFNIDHFLIANYQTYNDDNGAIDESVNYVYDLNNKLLREETDFNNDGISDQTNTYSYTYDSSGNILTKSFDDISTGFGADELWTYTYDANNNRTSEIVDENADGLYISKTQWTYDNFNRKLSKSVNQDNDSSIEEFYSWSYNSKGHLIQKTRYGDSSQLNKITETVDLEYDEKGNIVKSSKDYDDDTSMYELVTLVEYDDDNRPTKFSMDGDGWQSVNGQFPTNNHADGFIDETFTYSLSGNLSVYDHYFIYIDQDFLLDI